MKELIVSFTDSDDLIVYQGKILEKDLETLQIISNLTTLPIDKILSDIIDRAGGKFYKDVKSFHQSLKQ
jgi:hypothetical protein